MLYQLKNNMTFRKLGQLQMVRFFTDGTKIVAKSVFGRDQLIIDVTGSTLADAFAFADQQCTITITFLNQYVQPMRYPGEIKDGEQEGIDYIKTYYAVDKSNCSFCADDIEWEFSFNYETDEQIDYYDSEPENHCVISQDGGCHGEVIERGSDENGTYIIWKAYTEALDYNRSGLGYMRFYLMLKNKETNDVICEYSEIIGVDCCIKDGLSEPAIYWECWQMADCSEFVTYAGTKLGRVPESITLSELFNYAFQTGGSWAPFYSIPEIGGCPSYAWTFAGPGSIESDDIWQRMIIYRLPSDLALDCQQDGQLTVSDRCGGKDSVIFLSACDTPGIPPVEIHYTTLLMGPEASQTLTVTGGVGPYTWSLSGGGTLTQDSYGLTATYTSPATNPNCSANATIVVRDCCGDSDQIKIAVNTYTGNEPAYRVYTIVPEWGGDCQFGHECGVMCYITNFYDVYRCDGVLLSADNFWGGCLAKDPCAPFIWPYNQNVCNASSWQPLMYRVFGGACPQDCVMHPDGDVEDVRTNEMKEDGCCPINPYTGLPF